MNRPKLLDDSDLRAELERVTAMADNLAAALILVLHDAHPVYASTTGWRGGIGGQAMTPSCSIIDPPPDALWTQQDVPSGPAREWLAYRGDFDLDAAKERLKVTFRAAFD